MRLAEQGYKHRIGSEAQVPADLGVSVSKVASGRQANRTGAYGEVPRPAETCSHAASAGASEDGVDPAPGHHRETPLARRRSRSQLVTNVPYHGRQSCPPWVWPAMTSPAPSAVMGSRTRVYGAWVTPTVSAAEGSLGPATAAYRSYLRWGSSTPTNSNVCLPIVSVVRALLRSTHPAETKASTRSAVGSGMLSDIRSCALVRYRAGFL